MSRVNIKQLNDQKAFTLIELMIVIAIIGILAAIAIPLMAGYRTRAFNSSALSDIKNLASFESALFSDLTMYGATEAAANAAACSGTANRTGAVVTGDGVLLSFITTQDAFVNQYVLQIGVSKGNSMFSTTASLASSSDMYSSQSKHINGDIVYGMENDSTDIYQNTQLFAYGDALTTANEVVPTGNPDYASAGGGWTVK
jgi:prepilin-type N-terminal cleavage/methylation domain-containing protein